MVFIKRKISQKKKLYAIKRLKENFLDSLNTKSNKAVFVKNTIMTNIIKNCKGEKRRGVRSAEGFRRKLFIPGHEIYESIEHKVKSKIGTIFKKEKILEEY